MFVDHPVYNSLQDLHICANIELSASNYSPDRGVNNLIFDAGIKLNGEVRKCKSCSRHVQLNIPNLCILKQASFDRFELSN